MAKKMHTATIIDVAQKAGVSQATTSRVLSGKGYASEETRKKVTRAADELHYKPHALARSLAQNATNSTIGLIITDIVNPFYSYLADGVLDCAMQYGYHVIVLATDEEPSLEKACIDVLTEERVAGIIAVPTGRNHEHWREALDIGLEIVLVDRDVSNLSNSDVILVDNYKGAYSAVSYLISLGHQRIGMLTGPLTTTTGRERLAGYRRALEDAHIPLEEGLIQFTSFKREDGTRAAQQLLSLSKPPTSFFAANNILAEAAYFEIQKVGFKVPEDISILMFDDVPWASLVSPQITVVSQPTHTLGYMSVDLLNRRLTHKDQGPTKRTKVVLEPELIIRGSCAAPRK
jgi:LacI family transcriptional regulator